MIDYKLLEALAIVVQEGGFEKAASVLHLTQSAISQRVRLLEERSGKILLSRTSPPKPTDAGMKFIKHYLQVKLLEHDLDEETSVKKAGPTRLSLGINADTLSSWFLPAIGELLNNGELLIDLHVDDQEETYKLLRDGVVIGCISDRGTPIQGCTVDYLGAMHYRLLARPEFISKWFSDGFTPENVENAPAVMFTRKDMLHYKMLWTVFGLSVNVQAIHYVPSIEQYTQMISSGYAYGMVPDWQSEGLRSTGDLIEVHGKAHDSVKLYWHCWNIDSSPLKTFSKQLIIKAKSLIN